MVVVGGQQNASPRKGSGLPEHPQGLHEGGNPPFHIRGPGAVQHSLLEAGRRKGQVDRVQVPVELQGASRLAAVQAGHHRRGLGPVGLRAFHPESVFPENGGQSVGRRSGASGGTGNFHQGRGRFHQPPGLTAASSLSVIEEGRVFSAMSFSRIPGA